MSEVPGSVAELRERILSVAMRPGMWGLRDDYRQVTAFVTGCQAACPDDFDLLNAWAITRIKGACDKYGWPYALAVLAAQRVSDTGSTQDPRTPLARAFLMLVCEYLGQREAPDAPSRIRAEYDAARSAYLAARDAFAHSHGTDVWDPRWHKECWEWKRSYVPELVHAPNPEDPWAPGPAGSLRPVSET